MADQARIEAESWQIEREDEQLRVDTFVRKRLPHLSRRQIDSAIREQLFSLNGKATKKGDRVGAGDVLVFHGSRAWLAAQPSRNSNLEVRLVYEDSALLIVDKPAGMPTHGFSARDDSTLANFIAAQYPALLGVGKSPWEPGILHRLDRETSGLVMIAKTQSVFDEMRRRFRCREIAKTYWALVWGKTGASGTVALPLAHDSRDRRRMQALNLPRRRAEKTWKAVTHYKKLAQSRGLSLLEIKMVTGVTHQIRAHLAAIGHPIVGDRLYGKAESDAFGLQRHFLHAGQLDFYHSQGGRRLIVETSLPDDLRKLLLRLRIRI